MAQQPPAAVIPPIPADDFAAFEHVLEHVIGLDTQAKRDRVLINIGVQNAYQLLLMDMDGLIEGLTVNTSGLSKMRLKAMRKWAEEEQDTFGEVDIRRFTLPVCEIQQRIIARTGRALGQTERSTTSKEKLNTFNGNRKVILLRREGVWP
jgi:hypothetical protein